jgi:uncharacterized phiE125 gp8 family phage protein
MALFRTVEPAVEPVTLAEAKAHLRLDGAAEDELLAGLIRAARQELERATGLALIDQHWRMTLDAVPETVAVPLHPIREIVAVTAFGSEGDASTVPAGDYTADLASRPARLRFLKRPSPGRSMNGIEIDVRAGFGEAGGDVPEPLRRALLVLVAHWYEFRAGFGPDEQPVSFPPVYERMIAPWRDRRL